MLNLRPLQSGETDLRTIGSWLNKLRDYVEGFSNINGKGGNTVLWHGNTPTIAFRGGSNSSSGGVSAPSTSLCYLCKITGGDSTSYTVDIYTEKDGTSTGSGTLQVANMHINETLAVNTWVVGHPAIVTVITGN